MWWKKKEKEPEKSKVRIKNEWSQETMDKIERILSEGRSLTEEEMVDILKAEGRSRRALASLVYSIRQKLIRKGVLKERST
ncbi:hypothetical protein [Candidatus Contubernalis alkaliaceticus]|uniref:hypothetical protein n=1 Tax=Candidatus Contubernalis alkaliaceticus TaxID=338645 RepID=UPI001F4BEECC|nr:hypothetical protein [Candidatus Contubernalis alkalaceticus]UNC91344.1 hypothetical protein HUE98_04110 [Candidatus Contubernalis alkalaceticus]